MNSRRPPLILSKVDIDVRILLTGMSCHLNFTQGPNTTINLAYQCCLPIVPHSDDNVATEWFRDSGACFNLNYNTTVCIFGAKL